MRLTHQSAPGRLECGARGTQGEQAALPKIAVRLSNTPSLTLLPPQLRAAGDIALHAQRQEACSWDRHSRQPPQPSKQRRMSRR